MTNQDPGTARAPNKSSIVYKRRDGRWHGRVSMGDDEGRRTAVVTGATRASVSRKVRDLEKLRDSGRAATAGRAPLVATSLSHWLENIAARTVRPRTLDGYRTYSERYAIPGLVAHRLIRLQAEHIEALYARMQQSGLTPGTVHSLHRILRTALNEAVRRDKLSRNPVLRARPPRLTEREMEPLTRDEAARLIHLALSQRDGARWSVALALGLRKGEALGTVLGRGRSRRGHPHRPPCSATAHSAARLRRHLWAYSRSGLSRPDRRCPRSRRAQEPCPTTPHRRRRVALPRPLVESLRAHYRRRRAENKNPGQERVRRAACRSRTDDLRITSASLYRLS